MYAGLFAHSPAAAHRAQLECLSRFPSAAAARSAAAFSAAALSAAAVSAAALSATAFSAGALSAGCVPTSAGSED